MVPFRLDVEIRTPLAGGDIPTLDAVLLGELARLNPDQPDYARAREDGAENPALEALRPLLKMTDGVPHASVLMFESEMASGKIIKTNRRTRELGTIGSHNWLSNVSKMSYTKGPYSSSLSEISHRTIGNAEFRGVGDINKIKHVLRLWRGMGAQWRNGWGEIVDWEIQPCQSADPDVWGLVENARPLRPLPHRIFVDRLGGDPAYPVAHRRVAPPYWSAAVPRVPAVVPDERPPFLPATTAIGRIASDENVVDFMLRRFVAYMMPDEEQAERLNHGGTAAVVARALSRNYKHREGKKDLRLGDNALAVVSESETLLFSHAVPEGISDASFREIPPEEGESKKKYRELLWQAVMDIDEGSCVILTFQKKSLSLDSIFMFSSESDCVVVSGAIEGMLYRSAIRRILEIAQKGGLSQGHLKKWRDAENRRRNNPEAAEVVMNRMEKEREKCGLEWDEWCDLLDLLVPLTKAGWAVLDAAPTPSDSVQMEEQ